MFFGAPRVVDVIHRLTSADIPCWLDGGWGIDALLGEEGRVHGDLDLVVRLDDVDRIAAATTGYDIALDGRPTRVVLRDGAGHEIDLHPVTFDGSGTGWQAGAGPGGGDAAYPASGFTTGTVAGRSVGCLSADLQARHHTGYPPDAVDLSDVARLRARFGVTWPATWPALVDRGPGEELPGGNITPVEKVGDTVRRRIGPWTPAVHALLARLADRGFEGAPRVLGIDVAGDEVLGHVDGETCWPCITPTQASDESLIGIGHLVRRYHDAVAGWTPPPDARWAHPVGSPDSGEVVCHNDISTWNLVWHGTRAIALLDWDLAAPGTRLWDLAYCAWRFVPLYDGRDQDGAVRGWPRPLRQPERLRMLADAYGLDGADRATLLDVVAERQQSVVESIRTWGEEGLPAWREMWDARHAEMPRRDIRALHRYRSAWERSLLA